MISPGWKIDLEIWAKVVRDGLVKELTFAELPTRPTLVSVYMKNNPPSCDRQNCRLAARAAEFHRVGFNLIALSRNTCGSHIRYVRGKNISYTLVSDPEDKFTSAADSRVQKSMYGRTYVGPGGVCARP